MEEGIDVSSIQRLVALNLHVRAIPLATANYPEMDLREQREKNHCQRRQCTESVFIDGGILIHDLVSPRPRVSPSRVPVSPSLRVPASHVPRVPPSPCPPPSLRVPASHVPDVLYFAHEYY